jgi:LmbE family N-acetylglucosaminyl deacetylase
MTKRILVVAAHPDDEILGCGGTIAKLSSTGNEVHIVIMAEGSTSRSASRDVELHREQIRHLSELAYKTNTYLGAASVTLHGLPDNRMDSLELLDVIKIVESEIERIRPEVVFTHHSADLNIDHRIIHDCVLTACRPQPAHPTNRILFFEVPSSTEWRPNTSVSPFVPNWFEDIAAFLSLKLKALEQYESEVRPWPHARSVKAAEYLARWRGASVGVDAAEGFVLGRNVNR